MLSGYRVRRARPLTGDVTPEATRLPQHGQAAITIARMGIWTATGLSKPDSAWWLYQVAAGGEISGTIRLPRGALEPTSTAGGIVDVSAGYVVGCNAAGEILIAGPEASVTVTLTVWAANL